MVKISTRRKLIRELEVIIRFLIIDEKENTDEFSEIMDIYQGICSTRMLNERSSIPKTSGMRDFIWNLEFVYYLLFIYLFIYYLIFII